MITVDPKINIGNILTSVSIIFALGTFLYNEAQKREQVDRAYAAEVRKEMGSVLREVAQMDAELKLLFLTVEPRYVTASEIALEGGEEERDYSSDKARDFLWREISSARAEMERRILSTGAQSNGLAVAGAELQSAYELFLQEHSDIRLFAFSTLSLETQEALNRTAADAKYSAVIGNALREAHYAVERTALQSSTEARKQMNARIHAASQDYE